MSAKSSFLRSVYGVPPPKTATKYRWYRKQRAGRTKIHLRAAEIFDRELEKVEARKKG